MATIYFVRHQAAGLLVDFPFAAYPSDEQLSALNRLCFQRHGATHPKDGEPYWLDVTEIQVLGSEVPDVPDRTLKFINDAGVSQNAITGIGRVE